MPYANNKGVKIYYEVEGKGPPLVLAHGVSEGMNRWRNLGYTDGLKNEYRLILFEARGHGRSDKPHDPADYGLNMVDDVVALLDHLGIERAHYLGYSLGATVGYQIAIRYPGRLSSCVFVSSTPYDDEGKIKERQVLMEGFNILINDPEAYVRHREAIMGRPLDAAAREVQLANDGLALIALGTNVHVLCLTDRELSLISVPCLVLCGDLDGYHPGAKEGASHIPNARFISCPGVGHELGRRSDLVLPHVKKFLAEVSRA